MNHCQTEGCSPVLLVEDNEDDAFLVRKAFESVGVRSPLFVVSDGKQALRYLEGQEQYADRVLFPFPRLMLLDLKLPGLHGFEVLSAIRQKKAMASLNILILSASSIEADIEESYRRGANAYLVKPRGMANLVEMVRSIDSFWLKQNRHLSLDLWKLFPAATGYPAIPGLQE